MDLKEEKAANQEEQNKPTNAKASKVAEEKAEADTDDLYPGSNIFINRQVAGKPRNFTVQEGAIILNFENTSIREVVKTILGDILEKNYVISKAVQGTVTVQTGRPLPKEDLIPVLETLLRMNNATLVRSQGLYKVVPISLAVQGNLSPRLGKVASAAGYSVRIFPLQYVGAEEMKKLLEPFVPQGAILYVDPARNLLMLAGTPQQLAYWQETINIFDVNWLEGMSVGIYPLENREAEKVVGELNTIFGPDSKTPLAGMMRFVPIENLNAVLVITPQSDYLEEARKWVERLDQGKDTETQRLYVYSVKNGKAEHLAEMLQQVFGQGGGSGATPAASVAPGRQATSLFSSSGGGYGSSGLGGGFGSSSGSGFGSSGMGSFKASQATNLSAFQAENKGAAKTPETPKASQPKPPETPKTSRPKGIEFGFVGAGKEDDKPEVKVIADALNNALLILATPPQHEKIQRALRQLDIPPRQVLVQATIAEVQLTDSLQYGIRWFFENTAPGNYGGTGAVNLDGNFFKPFLGAGGIAAAASTGGFSYALTHSGKIRALLQALAARSKLNVLSSPQLMVLNNHTAEIRVGRQIPIQTGSAIGFGGTAVQRIQYRDTGVLLTVTPRVNAGGRVTLELKQEVIDVGPTITVGSGIDNKSFIQRSFESVVTVQSGETIVLGGLIKDKTVTSSGGVPFLHTLPIIGSLFGSTSATKDRTELIVLLTPRVVRNQYEAQMVTEELRQKLERASAIVEGQHWEWNKASPSADKRSPDL